MAKVILDRDECGEGFLPPVCIRCGEAATGVRQQYFQSTPPVLYLLVFICFPLFLVLFFVLRKKMNVALPVCERHQGMWLRRQLISTLGIVSIVGGVIGGVTFGYELDNLLDTKGAGVAVVVIGLLVAAICFGIAGLGMLRPTRITNDTITLSGVSPIFADTVEQYRILLDDED